AHHALLCPRLHLIARLSSVPPPSPPPTHTLSLHDALPISPAQLRTAPPPGRRNDDHPRRRRERGPGPALGTHLAATATVPGHGYPSPGDPGGAPAPRRRRHTRGPVPPALLGPGRHLHPRIGHRRAVVPLVLHRSLRTSDPDREGRPGALEWGRARLRPRTGEHPRGAARHPGRPAHPEPGAPAAADRGTGGVPRLGHRAPVGAHSAAPCRGRTWPARGVPGPGGRYGRHRPPHRRSVVDRERDQRR